ncbi:response regulator [Chitinivorax sp. B]|uniref:response regulator n=1 Tax=Chitinivorax sp. B TaxID=2502235 RepID=UPI0010F4B68A|nr:response regulator [Chitinivorax sp. B]
MSKLFQRLSPLLPIAVILLSLTLSGMAAWLIARNNQKVVADSLQDAVARFANQVENRMGRYEYGLRGMAGQFIHDPDQVTLLALRRYLASRDLAREFPGALGYGVIRFVNASDRDVFLLRWSREHGQPIRIRQLNAHAGPHFIIFAIEPLARNQAALGLDIASEPLRHAAALQALRSGSVVLSAPVTLMQDEARMPGFLFMLPIYQPGRPHDTPTQREQAIWGWAYVPVRIDGVLSGLEKTLAPGLDVSISDTGGSSGRLGIVYDSDGVTGITHTSFVSIWGDIDLTMRRDIQIGGRTWQVAIAGSPRFVSQLQLKSPNWVAVLGIAMGLLLAGVIWALQRTEKAAVARAAKLTEMARASEARLALALSATGLGLWDWNIQTNTVVYNEQWAAQLGYRLDEVTPELSTWENLVHRDDLPKAHAALEAHFSGKTPMYQCDQRLRTKSGEWKWIRDTGQVIERSADNKPLRAIGTHLDIDEMMAREAVLQDMLNMHDVIFNNASVGIALTVNRVFRHCSAKLLDMLGYERSEIEGQSGSLVYDSQSAYDEVGRVAAAVLPAGGMLERELWVRRKDGSRFWARLLGQAVDPGDSTKGTIWIVDDFTERKQREELLSKARADAEAANRAKTEFLANISHEIRTPMNAVLGFTTLLMDTRLSEEQYGYVKSISDAGDVLMRLINDMLDLSKVEAGRLELELIDFDLRRLFDDVLGMVATKAADKKLELIMLTQPELPRRVNGDPGRIRQILLNLISNAVKFTEQGEIQVQAALMDATPESFRIRVSVIDTGIGIEREVINRLFHPFTQADASMTRRYGGTGLGLSISKRLAEAMQGDMGADSRPGKGSTFWFEVSLGMASEVTPPAIPEVGLAGRQVLLCGRSPSLRQMLQAMLRDLGIVATPVGDAIQALQVLKQSEMGFDCVIVDYQLPDMTGIELAERIRAEERFRSLPMIMLSSLAWRGQGKEARQAHFAAYLVKPVRVEQLAACLRAVLSPEGGGDAAMVTSQTLAERRVDAKHTILVAEDNVVNQRVVVLMLEKMGCRVDVVENGEQAVSAATQYAYDLILMDGQMPVMDGIEAARRIRAAGVLTPISALTANVFESTRQACMAAGMNDFLTKPITADALQQVMVKWIPELAVLAPINGPQAVSTVADSGDDPDEDRISLRKALDEVASVLGDDIVPQLIDLYRQAVAEVMPQIEVSLGERDWDRLVRSAHRLKGSAAQIGASRVADNCKELELAARNHLTDNCAYYLVRLNLEIQMLDGLIDSEKDIRAGLLAEQRTS